MELTRATAKFVAHWGELGTRWGINRTVGQIHALLYISTKPLDAEAIGTALSVARSNVSASVRELLAWGLIRRVHILGDRRDHFEAVADPWEMLTILAQERKRREIDPTITVLRECAAELSGASLEERQARKRLDALRSLIESVSALLDEFTALPPAVVKHVVGLQGRLHTLLRAGR